MMTIRELIDALIQAKDLDAHAVVEVMINTEEDNVYRTAEIEDLSFYKWGVLLNCKE